MSEKKSSIAVSVFESDHLEYGEAPEDSKPINAWLEKHNRKFGHFINNKWVHPPNRKYQDSISTATMEVLAQTINGNEEDVNIAIHAAKTAYPKWSGLSPHERAKFMYSVARHVQKHSRLLATLESLDNGKTFRETKNFDVPQVVRHWYHHAGWAQIMPDEMSNYKSLGVVAAIVPFNFPLMLLCWKVCPALAMGNTVVVKASTQTRLSALLLAEIIAEAGIPPGVYNVINGCGSAVGNRLADHPDIAKIGFTGSTFIGKLLRKRIAGSGKKISLELSGKSPFIVFDSADIDSAIEGVVDSIWFNQGSVCCAGSRLLVQESIEELFIAKLKRRMGKLRIGHSLQKNVDMGPLVDNVQYEDVDGYIKRAKEEGCEIYQPDIELPKGGLYYKPTLILNCFPTNECVREDIFGPVLSAMSFRTPEEAIELANNTKFGLGGSVWTEDVSLALEVAVSIRAGVIWINAHNLFDSAAGFGGYRESGFGRDGGKEGLYEYVKPKWMPEIHPNVVLPCKAIKWPSFTPLGLDLPDNVHEKEISNYGLVVDRTAKMYYGGAQKRGDWGYSRAVKAPDGTVIEQVAEGNRKDIRNAVEAAHKAKGGWGKRAAHDRSQIAFYIAENLMARFNEFSNRISLQTGRNIKSCEQEVAKTISRLFYYASYADKYGGRIQETTLYGVTSQINEAIGVVGVACPTEYPLLGMISLIMPLIIRGNAVVVVPSPEHPLCATDLYQVFDTSDLPGGVVNIITGDREFLVKTMVEHQDIDAIWYFGEDPEGSQRVEYGAAESVKRTFVNYGYKRDWQSDIEGQGEEFLRNAVQVKNIWIPMGSCR